MSGRKSADQSFDFTIKAYDNKLTIYENKEFKNLSCWYNSLNHYEKEGNEELEGVKVNKGTSLESYCLKSYEVTHDGREVTIMSLTFKLNQLLMLINNPIFFPHRAYAKIFRDGLQELSKQRQIKKDGEE
jgi:hypothetical protein